MSTPHQEEAEAETTTSEPAPELPPPPTGAPRYELPPPGTGAARFDLPPPPAWRAARWPPDRG